MYHYDTLENILTEIKQNDWQKDGYSEVGVPLIDPIFQPIVWRAFYVLAQNACLPRSSSIQKQTTPSTVIIPIVADFGDFHQIPPRHNACDDFRPISC